jgi:hypothetical protein
VLHDHSLVYANLHFDGLTRQGDPWSIDQAVPICGRDERDHGRVTSVVHAMSLVARRLMRDVQDDRFGERPWLGLTHLHGAMRTLVAAPARRTRTAEACEAVMLASRDLRGLLAPPAAALDAAVLALDAWLGARAAIVKLPAFELCSVPDASWSDPARTSSQGVEATRAGLRVTLRMITRDDDDGQIRDIKEQQVLLVPAAMLSDIARVIACLDGWAATLPRAIIERLGKEVETMMPFDFFDGSVLELKTPRSAEDFAAAFARRWKLQAG